MRRLTTPVFWALVTGSTTVLLGQITSTAISGKVVDASGNPLQGVRVAVSGPQLPTSRVAVTDASGNYRFSLMPVGAVSMSFSKDGFRGRKVEARLTTDQNMRQDLVLTPVATASEVVEVIGSSSKATTIDKTDVGATYGFNSETLSALPTMDRGFVGAASLAPGVAIRGGVPTLRGGAAYQTNYRVDGTDVKSDYDGGASGDKFIEDAIEDIQVVLTPIHPRYSRDIGGSINAITKSGSNTFAGSIRLNPSRNAWGINGPRYGAGGSDAWQRTTDIFLSGPVIKDRLFFTFTAKVTPTSVYVSDFDNPAQEGYTIPVKTGVAAFDAYVQKGPGTGYKWFLEPGNGWYHTGNSLTGTQKSSFYTYKLTSELFNGHSVEAGFSTSRYFANNGFTGNSQTVSATQVGDTESTETNSQVSYKGILSSSLFMQARLNWHKNGNRWSQGPFGGSIIDPKVTKPATASLTGYIWSSIGGYGAPAALENRDSSSGAFEFKYLAQFLGAEHEMDFGADQIRATRSRPPWGGGDNNVNVDTSGAWINASGEWRFPVWTVLTSADGVNVHPNGWGRATTKMDRFLGPSNGVHEDRTQGIYFADAITVNKHLNFFLGLRYERVTMYDTDHSTLASAKNVSPRFMVRYDLKGDGKDVLDFSITRVAGNYGLGIMDLFIKQNNSITTTSIWADPTLSKTVLDVKRGLATPDQAMRWVSLQDILNPANYREIIRTDKTKQVVLDPNLNVPYTINLEFSYKHAFPTGGKFQINATHREFKNAIAVDYDFSDPSREVLLTTNAANNTNVYGLKTKFYNSNELKKRYNSVEMSWDQRLTERVSLIGKYTWARLVGNDEMGDQIASWYTGGRYRRSMTPYFRMRTQLLANNQLTNDDFAPEGTLNGQIDHDAALSLIYTLPMGKGRMNHGFTARFTSGSPYSLTQRQFVEWGGPAPSWANAPDIGWDGAFASNQYQQYYSNRNAYRTNAFTSVDYQLDWEVPLGVGTLRFMGYFKVNNMFNTQTLSDTIRDGTIDPNNRYTQTNGYAMNIDWNRDEQIFYGRTFYPTNFFNPGRTFQVSLGLKF